MRGLIGAWRLLRALAHLAAACLVATRLSRHDEAGRQARIRWFARGTLAALGIELEVVGSFRPGAKLIVSNHVSWLDIAAIHAACPEARFVSKAEVLRWPLLGWLIRSAGTLFIVRERTRDSKRVVHEMAAALARGESVAVFPEGTTSAGHEMLPFHAGLLQSAIATTTPIQGVALRYSDATAAVSAAPAYTDDVNLVQSAWRVACGRGLRVRVQALPALATAHADRRALAARLRQALSQALTSDGGASADAPPADVVPG